MVQRSLRGLIGAPLALAMCALAAGCGSNKSEKFAYVEQPAEVLYTNATTALEKKRYEMAVPLFEEVERQHPYSPWARRAMLMKSYAYYSQNEYEDAIGALDQFVALHPGNSGVPYAYYLKAMCHYERIRDVGRDQNITNNAVQALLDVTRRYPSSEYARDARLKLDLTYDHLAGKEMYVGRFYQRAGKLIAAINRYQFVVENYETTSHVPEALHRLVESYLQAGVAGEARRVAAVLGHNYPGSEWYKYSYDLLADNSLLEPGSRPKSNPKFKKKKDEQEKLRGPVDLGDAAKAPVLDDQDILNNDPVPTNRPEL